MKKYLLVPVIILVLLMAATLLVVLYGKGYRIGFKQDIPKITKTGILVANSTPNGAQVFIDGHLTTATNNNTTLPPGVYDVKIQKEGYFPWEKKLKIEEEVVTTAEARLFPVAPVLASIATTAVQNPAVDPSGTKIAYQIASESSARKNGIYVLNMSANNISVPILTLQSSSTQIADDTSDQFSKASIKWSPDGTQILAEIDSGLNSQTTYLLRADRLNDTPQDVTAILQSVSDTWNQQKTDKNRSLLTAVNAKMQKMINDKFTIIAWSPDENKILYQASASGDLPIIIEPRRIGINTLVEDRKLKLNEVYIYDTKEDVNVHLPVKLPETCKPESANSEDPFEKCKLPVSWLPDSDHIVYVNDKKIVIMDDDGSNSIIVYAGPFVDTFAVPWPDTSKIVILTNFSNPDVSPTLYTIGLK